MLDVTGVEVSQLELGDLFNLSSGDGANDLSTDFPSALLDAGRFLQEHGRGKAT